ncbi:MAG TPA: hypothetical protein VIF15_20685 [Polyangiaceae bacterium]
MAGTTRAPQAARSGLALLAGVFAANVVLELAWMAAWSWLFDASSEDWKARERLVDLFIRGDRVVVLGAEGATLAALWLVSRARLGGGARAMLWTAFGLAAFRVVLGVLGLVHPSWTGDSLLPRLVSLSEGVAFQGGLVLVVLVAARLPPPGARGTSAALATPAIALAAIRTALNAASLLAPEAMRHGGQAMLWGARSLSMGSLALALAVMLVSRAALARSEDTAVAAEAGGDPSWAPVASAIAILPGLAIARVTLAVGAMVLFVVAAASKSWDAARGAMLLGGLVGFVLGVVVLASVVRVARAPAASGAAAPAVLTIVAQAAAMLLDVWALSLLMDVVAGASATDFWDSSVSRAMDAAAELPWVGAMGELAGIVAMLALLRAMRNIARHLDLRQLRKDATGVSLLLVVTGALAIALQPLASAMGDAVIVVALVVLVVALVAFAKFVALARGLAAGIREARAV